jgi:zinc transporter ZupT
VTEIAFPEQRPEGFEDMIAFLQNLQSVIQALLATCFPWALTALGAAIVFTARDVSKRVLDTRVSPVTVRRKAPEQ